MRTKFETILSNKTVKTYGSKIKKLLQNDGMGVRECEMSGKRKKKIKKNKGEKV